MPEKLYSVEELATILDLHPKTVQRFLREGKIKGRKIGRSWKATQEDLKEFAHAELAPDPSAPPVPAVDYAVSGDTRRLRVSTVVELHEKDPEESSRISNSLMAMLNCKDPTWGPVDFRVIQYPETGTARFILNGSPQFIVEMMRFFQIIADQEEDS